MLKWVLWVIGKLFEPPEMPPIRLPLPARMVPAVKATIQQAFELAYHRGVLDGFFAGCLLVLVLTPAIRSRHARSAKEHVDVTDIF